MKQLLLVVLLVAVPGLALADDDLAATNDKTCATLGSLAKHVMQLRQRGTDMSFLVNELTGYSDMIIAAYKQPRFRTADMQAKAAQDFSNEEQVQCYEYVKDKAAPKQ